MMRIRLVPFLFALFLMLACVGLFSRFSLANNGFDLTNSSIPTEKILPGGPVKDGIPSIDSPQFIPVEQVSWLKGNEQVLSLSINGVTRAYPIAILNWHEIVNDNISGSPVVVSYCPLCGTGMAFSAKVDGRVLEFGVSGLLYNSDVLLYDRQTESLWSQLMTESVSGPMQGGKLEMLALHQMTWAAWRKRYSDGQVLSRDTGYVRDYSRSPYAQYDDISAIYFPVEFLSRAYHPKERVLGVEVAGKFKAYPFAELAKYGGDRIEDKFNGVDFEIHFDALSRTGEIRLKAGDVPQPSVNAFWFAWYTFHPDTQVFVLP
ncbi:MAG: DUF3179 domain-containing protein [Pseudomonadales bacterium]